MKLKDDMKKNIKIYCSSMFPGSAQDIVDFCEARGYDNIDKVLATIEEVWTISEIDDPLDALEEHADNNPLWWKNRERKFKVRD